MSIHALVVGWLSSSRMEYMMFLFNVLNRLATALRYLALHLLLFSLHNPTRLIKVDSNKLHQSIPPHLDDCVAPPLACHRGEADNGRCEIQWIHERDDIWTTAGPVDNHKSLFQSTGFGDCWKQVSNLSQRAPSTSLMGGYSPWHTSQIGCYKRHARVQGGWIGEPCSQCFQTNHPSLPSGIPQ